jgi:hypothetical protein
MPSKLNSLTAAGLLVLGAAIGPACAEGAELGFTGRPDADEPSEQPEAGADASADVSEEAPAPPESGADTWPTDALLDPVAEPSQEAAVEAGPCTQCGSPGCGTCPTVATVAMGGQRIDSIEVTNAAYAEWLGTSPKLANQPAVCAFNTSFMPAQDWPASNINHPVTHVDWCDAYAYCAWAKKKLCGKVGGGANAYADFADATKSQWFKACTGGGVKVYPYGSTYVPSYCNGAEFGKGDKTTAGEASGCQGAYPGLFDMSGNVWEWEDSCDAANQCRLRGGCFENSSNALDCGVDSSIARSTTAKTIGFRCCQD